MSARKHTYKIQTRIANAWVDIIEDTRDFCLGFLCARKDAAPRSAYQMKRSDGKIIESVDAREDVSIGQIAGWPTAEQYEQAGKRALEIAALIREKDAKLAERRERREGAERRPWWCESHEREATHINKLGDRCCDPKLGGILIPCRAILRR